MSVNQHQADKEETRSQQQHLETATRMTNVDTLRALKNVVIIDVRSVEEVLTCKGGAPVSGSINVPLNVNGEPQSQHPTTALEFKEKLEMAEVLSDVTAKNTNFVTHCTAGNTSYVGRGARAAALLRDLGFPNSYNGGCVENIQAALESHT